MIGPALLEYEEISGVSGGTPRGRTQSTADTESPGGTPQEDKKPSLLTKNFTQFKNTLNCFGIDSDLIVQIFKQVT